MIVSDKHPDNQARAHEPADGKNVSITPTGLLTDLPQ